MTYIFQWKMDYPVPVYPSRAMTEKESWDWAIKWLRPDTMADDVEAEQYVRKHGQVVEEKK